MSIPYSCKACDHSGTARDTYAGQDVKCPKCEAIIHIGGDAAPDAEPAVVESPVERPPPTPPPPVKRKSKQDSLPASAGILLVVGLWWTICAVVGMLRSGESADVLQGSFMIFLGCGITVVGVCKLAAWIGRDRN